MDSSICIGLMSILYIVADILWFTCTLEIFVLYWYFVLCLIVVWFCKLYKFYSEGLLYYQKNKILLKAYFCQVHFLFCTHQGLSSWILWRGGIIGGFWHPLFWQCRKLFSVSRAIFILPRIKMLSFLLHF